MYGLHLSIFFVCVHGVLLENCLYNTFIVTLVPDVPVLGSFRATLFTFAPVHGFRPFVGQHHVHDLGGAQPHILLGGAFTQQVLAFVTPSVDFKHGA